MEGITPTHNSSQRSRNEKVKGKEGEEANVVERKREGVINKKKERGERGQRREGREGNW